MIIPTVVQGLEIHGSSDLSFKIEHGVTRRNMTLYKEQQNTDMVKQYSYTFTTLFFSFFLYIASTGHLRKSTLMYIQLTIFFNTLIHVDINCISDKKNKSFHHKQAFICCIKKKINTALSEQYRNSRDKSLKETKSLPLTCKQTHDRSLSQLNTCI